MNKTHKVEITHDLNKPWLKTTLVHPKHSNPAHFKAFSLHTKQISPHVKVVEGIKRGG